MYRPEGWAKIKKALCNESLKDVGGAHCKTCPAEPLTCDTSGERLVDALLEGLKKDSGVLILDNETLQIPTRYSKGYLVFIPEEG